MKETKLMRLNREFGQSIWIDFISRDALVSGELAHHISQGVLGLTSNPSIFEKAISSGQTYDADITALVAAGRSVMEIYEALALNDITAAADLLRPTYEATDAVDGYVSLEVSPLLAYDTAGTIAEAKRLFSTLGRPNVMIKVPGTPAGLPAIAELIGSGINVNVTLLFSLDAYEAAAQAYLQGLENYAAAGGDLSRVASVASFFVSRLDTSVDKLLAGQPKEAQFRGRAAIANAKLAYARFQQIFREDGPRWKALATQHARVQRPLWASTSTKNPLYPDTMYVDELIGPHTVNTVPPQTLAAFSDHGRLPARATIAEGLDEARELMAQLAGAGIDIPPVLQELLDAGVRAFSESFELLIKGLQQKAAVLAVSKGRPVGAS